MTLRFHSVAVHRVCFSFQVVLTLGSEIFVEVKLPILGKLAGKLDTFGKGGDFRVEDSRNSAVMVFRWVDLILVRANLEFL